MSDKSWESYEVVAAYLLNQFAEDFGLGKVEGKQVIPGVSGAKWEIDAKGYSEDGETFLIVECKRYTTNKISQEIVAGLAFRILDTGASGGFIVTPLGFQEGAQKVADHTGIYTVRLNQDCTRTDYVIRFLDEMRVGMSDRTDLRMKEHLTISLVDSDGNIVDRREIST